MEEILSGLSQLTNLAQLSHMKVPASHSLVVDHARSRVSEDKQRFRGLWTGQSGACMLTSLTTAPCWRRQDFSRKHTFQTHNKNQDTHCSQRVRWPTTLRTRPHGQFSTDFCLVSEISCAVVKRIFWRSLILLGICILGYFTRSKCFC